MTKLAIFDFDGTIYKRDTLFSFWFFVLRKYPERIIFAPYQLLILFLLKFKIINAQYAKEKFLIYITGLQSQSRDRILNEFWEKEFPKNFILSTLDFIREYKKAGCEIVCISASPDIFLTPICKEAGIDTLISTTVSFTNKQSLKIVGNNCRGKEKISRLYSIYNKENVIIEFAISDNNDDVDLLHLAKKHIKL